MTGTGTFENYVSVGAGCAATPDGRLKGQPTASDSSPQPYAQVCSTLLQELTLIVQVLHLGSSYYINFVVDLSPASVVNLAYFCSLI